MSSPFGSGNIYNGPEKVVIGIDLGTTMSAVSYAHLVPDTVPDVRIVNQWPGQPEASGDSKIPSIVAYRDTTAVAFGSQALDLAAGDPAVEVAKWFKLHLHPDSMKTQANSVSSGPSSTALEIPPLPKDVPIDKIYSDMLRWLIQHAKNFFKSHTVDGEEIWDRIGTHNTIILAIPNGWEIPQQHLLRKAIVMSGALPANFKEDQLNFVTEGEASVHYALQHSRNPNWLKSGVMFALTDAGGSTVDSTMYICKQVTPNILLEEVCASECVQAGSVFVDRAMHNLLERKLRASRFNDPEDIAVMVSRFEETTKRQFGDNSAEYFLRFGTSRDNDPKVDVTRGRLKLRHAEVQEAFSNVIATIIRSCSRLLHKGTAKHLLLVGGFGESVHLQRQLAEEFRKQNVQIVTVDESTKKAAAEGAVIWYTKQLVRARAARATFGVEVRHPFDARTPSHQVHQSLKFVDPRGQTCLRWIFYPMVIQDQVIDREESITRTYSSDMTSIYSLGTWTVTIYSYESQTPPEFMKDGAGDMEPRFREVCQLEADLSGLQRSLVAQRNPVTGMTYYTVDYTVAVLFGGTTLKARLRWQENGQLREGPIKIIPNSMI